MITELNLTDIYRLKDKEGWLSKSSANKYFIRDHPEILTGFVLSAVDNLGNGDYENAQVVGEQEYEFFEVVTEEKGREYKISLGKPKVIMENAKDSIKTEVVKGTLWDGKAPLEVGMVVKEGTFELKELREVVMVTEKQLILKSLGEFEVLSCVCKENVQAATKSAYEVTLEKALKAWTGKGLDYGFDTVSSSVPFGEVFEVIYGVMKGEKNV